MNSTRALETSIQAVEPVSMTGLAGRRVRRCVAAAGCRCGRGGRGGSSRVLRAAPSGATRSRAANRMNGNTDFTRDAGR